MEDWSITIVFVALPNCSLMNKDFIPILSNDKAIAFSPIEPFYGSGFSQVIIFISTSFIVIISAISFPLIFGFGLATCFIPLARSSSEVGEQKTIEKQTYEN
tara:strand:+ start:233 stop:538 length:306 start_codon:yes stop_codon:yes gene_type:complete